MQIDEIMALRARREAGEALIAYVRKTMKEKAGTRAQRKAANKAAWAAAVRRR